MKERLAQSDSFEESLIPRDLLKVTAILLREKMLKLESIWPHLSLEEDDEDEVETLCKLEGKIAEHNYRNLNEIVLNKELHEGTAENKQRNEEMEEIKRLKALMPYNLRLQLVDALVNINQWGLVDDILGTIYENKVNLTCSENLILSMCRTLRWFIDPILQQARQIKVSPFTPM